MDAKKPTDSYPWAFSVCEVRGAAAASAGDIATQLILHEMHHRAQVMNMLTRLGASVGDIDFNLMMYQRREA